MFHLWSYFTLILFISSCTLVHSTSLQQNFDENDEVSSGLFDLIKDSLIETNNYEQLILLNQLREYLNRMCVFGYFGTKNAHACQSIVEYLQKSDEYQRTPHTEQGRTKRFFCNGFIGCKSTTAAGR